MEICIAGLSGEMGKMITRCRQGRKAIAPWQRTAASFEISRKSGVEAKKDPPKNKSGSAWEVRP